MPVNATLFGQLVLVFALVMGLVCYVIGRHKTQRPLLTGLAGAFLFLVPLFGLIYLWILLRKKDLQSLPSRSILNSKI